MRTERREYLDLREINYQKNGRDCRIRSFIMYYALNVSSVVI